MWSCALLGGCGLCALSIIMTVELIIPSFMSMDFAVVQMIVLITPFIVSMVV